MSAAPGAGTLILSVDLDAPLADTTDDRRSIESAASGLLRAMGRVHMPATWFAVDPAASRLVDQILAADTRAEIALLGTPAWADSGASRQLFASELVRQARRVRAAGYRLNSLAVPGGPVDAHADLLVKHGFCAVRPAVPAQSAGFAGVLRKLRLTPVRQSPRPIRFGLWEVAATAVLPAISGAVARRRIDLATVSGGVVHLVLDVHQLVRAGRGVLGDIERTFEHAVARSEEGRLSVHNLAAVGAILGRGLKSSPATSILRARPA